VGAGAELELSEDERRLLGDERWAVCAATFYRDLADRLIAGAHAGFTEVGIDPAAVDVHEVPGAFELPLAAKLCAESGYAGVACVGVVIRGETDHYDFVCGEAARGIAEVGLRTGVPAAFGVITCDTREQAEARAGGDRRDQGLNAALAVVSMRLMANRLAGRPAAS
jgi:6,7-dimethyl-8-ribityllumazine synthase